MPVAQRGRLRPWLAVAWPIAAGAGLFLGAWQLLVSLGNYPAFILPTPGAVLVRWVTALQAGTIQPHAAATLLEVALGLLVGGGTGLLSGVLLARSRLAERLLSPYLVAAQATPILALAPLIALWFGTGLASRALICSLIVYFPIAVATMVGVRSVDGRLLELARSLRASRRQVLATFEVPGALPQILGGFRVGVTLAVVGAIVAEWAGGDRGLGVLINLARGSLFDTPLLFATLFTIAVLGVALYLSVVLLERRLVGPWRQAERP
jgi:putative riboflavin transport system permease protein